jgi:hypothetical protein
MISYFKHCNKLSGCINTREFLDNISYYQLRKEDPVKWS